MEESPILNFLDQLCFLLTFLIRTPILPLEPLPTDLFLSSLLLLVSASLILRGFSSQSTKLSQFFLFVLVSVPTKHYVPFNAEASDVLSCLQQPVPHLWFCSLRNQMSIIVITSKSLLRQDGFSTRWEEHEGCWFWHNKLPAPMPASLRSIESIEREQA